MTNDVQSPCVNVCQLNEADICTACFRHINEIKGWQTKSNAERQSIIEKIEQRKREME